MCSKALHNDFHAPVMVNSTRKHKKPIVSPPTLCIGAPVSHYVMGGGWELCTQSVIVNASAMTATAAPPSDLTLPYLTLPYLTLPYLTLPYLTLP